MRSVTKTVDLRDMAAASHASRMVPTAACMRYYPLYIDLSKKNILLVGAGEVGLRKAASILAAHPGRLEVVDPILAGAIPEILSGSEVVCHAREFQPADLEGKSLIFAATGNRELNARIAGLCNASGQLCNVIDAPALGSFIVPAHFRQNGISVALSTEGQSPALARKLRGELEAWCGKRYSPLLTILGRLRPLLLELELPTGENTGLFRSLIQSPLADLLEDHDLAAASELLATLLPESLHARMGELLHDL